MTSKTTACAERQIFVTESDIPLCCPMPNMRLWDAHPRVYLPIEETGKEVCPYCGTEYILKHIDNHHETPIHAE